MSESLAWRRLNNVRTSRLFFRRKRGPTNLPDSTASQKNNSGPPRCANTYRLEPAGLFSPARAERLMRREAQVRLGDGPSAYDAAACSRLALDLADGIKEATKALDWNRYKFVVQVHVGQRQQQSVMVASRCVWDQTTDNYASVSYENSSVFLVASLYATYRE